MIHRDWRESPNGEAHLYFVLSSRCRLGRLACRQAGIYYQSIKKTFFGAEASATIKGLLRRTLLRFISMQLYREGCKTSQPFTAFARLGLVCRSKLFFAVVHTFIIQSCLMLNQVMRRHGAGSIHGLATKLARVQ